MTAESFWCVSIAHRSTGTRGSFRRAASIPASRPRLARRAKCEEEIGLTAGRLDRLGSWYPTPGYCDEQMFFFTVSALAPPRAGFSAQTGRGEDIETQTVTTPTRPRWLRGRNRGSEDCLRADPRPALNPQPTAAVSCRARHSSCALEQSAHPHRTARQLLRALSIVVA